MKKNLIYFVVAVMTFLVSCNKNYNEFYSDNRPEIPVTFEGATTEGFNPYIKVPVATNNFTLTLTIPESSGRKIKEISKVSGGTTAINAGTVRAATYISNPIAGSNNKVVFNSSITEFRSKSAANETLISEFLKDEKLKTQEIAFMFLVTLDNGQEIIPVQARVWITK